MKILMPCVHRADMVRSAQEALQREGHTCRIVPYDGAEKLRRLVVSKQWDLALSAEGAPLAALSHSRIPSVYLAGDFFCADKLAACDCKVYLIAHEELSFPYITSGAKDTLVQPCGIPLRDMYRIPHSGSRALLGVQMHTPLFTVFADGVSLNEIKATVRAVDRLYPSAQTVVLTAERHRCAMWRSVFAAMRNVYVLETAESASLALSAADAVFTPAFAPLVCAAARQRKIVILLHTAVSRARRNASYLDERGIAFCGKTAADNVSFACRLLEGERLRSNMRAAQERYIISDAEARLVRAVEACVHQ